MESPTDAVLLRTAHVIDGLVRAVRAGDVQQTEEMLCQFCRLAEFEDLHRLRAALEADLWTGPSAIPDGLGLSPGAAGRR